MNDKNSLVEKIVNLEWDMFQNVQNVGGQRASCQDNRKMFDIMRISQFTAWSEPVLESYLNDLEIAKKEERNLLTEKYARMMESTAPLEYAQIRDILPSLDPDVPLLIDKIYSIMIEWEKTFAGKYPNIARRGRPAGSAGDSGFSTSIETYLKGELATYSKKTLELYYKNILDMQGKNINGAILVQEEMIKRYGYKSLEQADKMLNDL